MALPPHLLNLQQKLNSLNLPKIPIISQQVSEQKKEEDKSAIKSKNSITQSSSIKNDQKQKSQKEMENI